MNYEKPNWSLHSRQSIVMNLLILQAKRAFLLSKLCSRSRLLNLKKIFSSEWRNISASHFVNVWVRGFLGHLLGYSTCFSNYFSANYSLTFATPRTWKNTYYFPRRNGAYELKTNFCPFSPTFELCRTHTCLLGPRVFSNKWLTIYDAKPAAPALSVKLLIFGKKSYLRVKKNSAFVFYFWGWEAWSSFHVGSIE